MHGLNAMDRDFKRFYSFIAWLACIAVFSVLLIISIVVNTERKINKEKAWCADHNGVYIHRHCFNKEVVLR